MVPPTWCDRRFCLIVLLFFLFFVFQVGNSALTGNRVRHLTNWTDMVYVITFYCMGMEYWLLNGRFGVVTKIVYPVTLTQAWFVAAAMLALQLQDDEILEEAEETVGPVAIWLANIFIHYMMFPVSLVLLVFFFDKDELRGAPHQSVLDYYILTAPLVLSTIYAVWFNLKKQYPGNLDFIIIMMSGILLSLLGAGIYIHYLKKGSFWSS